MNRTSSFERDLPKDGSDERVKQDNKSGQEPRQSAAQGTYYRLILNIDGAARGNPGHAGIGAVVTDESGGVLLNISEYIGETTNNIAEYSALIFSLQAISEFNPSELRIFSDSELLVHQINGEYKVKNQNLKVYFGRAKDLLRAYRGIKVYHIERAKNKEADKLANKAIDQFLAGEKDLAKLDDLPQQEQLF